MNCTLIHSFTIHCTLYTSYTLKLGDIPEELNR
jgi:hypothetical protein